MNAVSTPGTQRFHYRRPPVPPVQTASLPAMVPPSWGRRLTRGVASAMANTTVGRGRDPCQVELCQIVRLASGPSQSWTASFAAPAPDSNRL